MATVLIIDFIVVLIISLLWVRAIDKQIENEQNEIAEWDATLNDGLEDEPEWWGGNNDNPDTNTTSETDTTGNPNTNITDETPELTHS